MMEPRQLRAFVAVAETLNFNRAAETLGIAQQSLSLQIARLEHTIGVRLFERSTRSVTLTSPGRRLLIDARDILNRLENAERNALLASRGQIGEIALGCGSYAVETILTEVLTEFRAAYPQVAMTLYELSTSEQLDALRRGTIDVCFSLLPPPASDLISEVLFEDGFTVAVAGDTRPAGPVPLATFKESPFVSGPGYLSPGLNAVKAQLFAEACFEPRIVQIANNTPTLLALVAAGTGVLLSPGAIGSFHRKDVTFIPIDTTHRIRICMLTRANADSSPELGNFCEVVRTTVVPRWNRSQ